MDTASPFGPGHPLNAVPASLVIESGTAITLDVENETLMPRARIGAGISAVLSSLGLEHGDIGHRQLGNELAGILAAFGSTDFESTRFFRHDTLLFDRG
jgi:hypothetical protein